MSSSEYTQLFQNLVSDDIRLDVRQTMYAKIHDLNPNSQEILSYVPNSFLRWCNLVRPAIHATNIIGFVGEVLGVGVSYMLESENEQYSVVRNKPKAEVFCTSSHTVLFGESGYDFIVKTSSGVDKADIDSCIDACGIPFAIEVKTGFAKPKESDLHKKSDSLFAVSGVNPELGGLLFGKESYVRAARVIRGGKYIECALPLIKDIKQYAKRGFPLQN